MALDAETFPNEIWMAIFDYLTDPHDLAQVVRANKRFNMLAIESLQYDIRWLDFRRVWQNFDFWEKHSSYTTLPRKLTFGIPTQYRVPFWQKYSALGDGRWLSAIESPPQSLEQPPADSKDLSEAYALYSCILSRVCNFPSLTEITFVNACLPSFFYYVITHLPHLKVLAISHCELPLVPFNGTTESHTLPISELKLERLRMGKNVSLGSGHMRQHPLTSLTASALSLRTLSLTWSLDVVMWVSAQQPEWQLPAVENLTIQASELVENTFEPLLFLIGICPALSHLCVRVLKIPTPLQLRHLALPQLRTYIGALAIAPSFLIGNAVENVEIDAECQLVPLLILLKNVPKKLRTLRVLLDIWDNEIIFAISDLLRSLEAFTVRYVNGEPTENFLISIGSQLLPRFEHLESVTIMPLYAPTNPTLLDSDIGDILLAWNRYCPDLRKAQLSKSVAWTRNPGSKWVMSTKIETYPPLPVPRTAIEERYGEVYGAY